MNNKILIISRAFPPAGGGGVQRIVKFSVYLQKLGWDVTVCTTKGKSYTWIDKARLDEIKNIKVIRIKEKPYKPSLINKIMNRLSFYDFYIDWAKSVTNYFKKINKFEYDFVLTSGPPHSVHKIGVELKKKFNFVWFSDFRDPFTLGPTYKAFSWFHKRFDFKNEQNIYTVSDRIITNTEINKEETIKKFRIEPVSKITSIYNGYDFADLKQTAFKPDYADNKINLLYLGGLRGDQIDGYFYKMLKKVAEKNSKILEHVKIHLVGDLSRQGSMMDNLKLTSYFKCHEAVSYNRVGDYISASDGCLTWQHPDDRYRGTIAGKLYDYFGLKKPIFSLGQPNSELDVIINEHKIGLHTNVNNLGKSANAFIKFLENLDVYQKNYMKLSETYYSSFNRVNQVKKLNQILMNSLN